MKLKLLLSALAFIGALSTFAEDNVQIDIDYNQIEVNVLMDKQHYRDQLDRFVAADTTMRLDEIALVYYGFPSTVDYDPTIDYADIHDVFVKKDYSEALKRVREEIVSDPVNLDLIVMGAISSSESQNPEDQAFLANMQERFNMIVSTIMASGRGIDMRSPFKLIRAADALIIIRNVLGVTDIVNEAQADNLMAYVFHFPGSQRDNILYFDITPQQTFLIRR